MSLLEVKNLVTEFKTEEGWVQAVRGVSFYVNPGETVGLVGESGCGKSVTARSIMRLIPQPPGRIPEGQVLFKGQDLLALDEYEMRKIRGNQISMIFQDPMTSLNPVLRVGFQLEEALMLHQKELTSKQRQDVALEMMRKVKIPSPEQRLQEYPHQLSGGMRQRVMIAMALACRPKLLLADEPTTALDVTVQAQILHLLQELREDFDTAIVLITHDLGVVAEVCDRIMVMYLGEIVEAGTTTEVFGNPKHPYTVSLMRSIPKIRGHREPGARLQTIRGMVPTLDKIPIGCSFAQRCDFAQERCRNEHPTLEYLSETTAQRCFYPQGKS